MQEQRARFDFQMQASRCFCEMQCEMQSIIEKKELMQTGCLIYFDFFNTDVHRDCIETE